MKNNNTFATYKNKEYLARLSKTNQVILYSEDQEDIENNFSKRNEFDKYYYKYIDRSEIDNFYKKIQKVNYLGHEFLIINQIDDDILICTMTGDYRTWVDLGFQCVDKGVYQKWVEKKDLEIKTEIEYI